MKTSVDQNTIQRTAAHRMLLRPWRRMAIACALSLILIGSAFSTITLPTLISNGMVLQRNENVRIWGTASPGERIALRFIDSTYSTVADGDGSWAVTLTPHPAGGPYEMRIAASDTILLTDILIGDVWVCSGQSNMELPMRRVSPIYGTEIANSTNSSIRQFAVPQVYDFNAPRQALTGGSWVPADPTTVLDFTAAGYFFARKLYSMYHVPIGLINASLGGSPVESWISEEALKAFPKYENEAKRWKDQDLIRATEESDRNRMKAWYALLRTKDKGYASGRAPWYSSSVKTTSWNTLPVPSLWYGTPLEHFNGVVWFRRDVTVPEQVASKPALLILGSIVDADSVFVNGIFVGTTGYQYPPRRYEVRPGIFKKGKNTITVRVISNIGTGGFMPEKEYVIRSTDTTIDLSGPWRYRVGASMEPLQPQTFIRWKPLGLYNGMISPLLNYRMKGVIWYQGESNAGRASDYDSLFTTMISDWRARWKEGDFPFLFVQLPNFMRSRPEPSESGWALLREAQAKALRLPNTGMAVTIDIGEWNDIHPLNKKDVGERLALAAEHVAYQNDSDEYSGPLYRSMTVEGGRIIISFSHAEGGLSVKGDAPHEFAIAGEDRRFVWAKAAIAGNTVVVWSDSVAHPVAVRYAWADNPGTANLYNKAGLPAAPFRTDQWDR